MRVLATILSSSIHIVLFGQAKNCYDISFYHEKSKCYLKPSRLLNDTFLAFLPQDCELRVLDSTISGVWKIFLHDSTRVIEILTTKNGKLSGNYKSFYRHNGQILKDCNYINDTLIGNYTSFYENGKIEEKGTCNSRGLTGYKYKYWDNGELAWRAKLKDDSYRGFKDEKYWNLKGRRIDFETFNALWYQCD